MAASERKSISMMISSTKGKINQLLSFSKKNTKKEVVKSTMTNENKPIMISPVTEDGSTDRKGNPAVKTKTGRWNSAVLLLVNYGLATLAFFGVGVNLVLFLTRVLEQDNAEAANNVSKWTGTVYICSLVGAFLSDSYLGRYLTCALFQIIYVLGLTLLSLTSMFLLVKPAGCGDGVVECRHVKTVGTAIFYLSIYLIALGKGGYEPTIATLGSDQFDENDVVEKRSKVAFFSYFYFALNAGSILSNTLLVYYEDSGKWVIGFWVSTGSAALALLLFLMGTPGYRHFKPSGNPLTRIAQVFVAALRKWRVEVPEDGNMLYEVEGKESAIAGSRKIIHSNEFRFLDKAATVAKETCGGGAETKISGPWKLCTVTQVEEVKAVLKLLPIWLCTIIYSVVFTQMASLFVEQGATMDTNIGSFHIPPASMSLFDILSVLLCIVLYRRLLIPAMARLSSNPRGLNELQRMGIGLAVASLAMVASGVLEVERLKRVPTAADHEPSSLSILWQIPQYAMIGASEVFMYVGQLEFFNGQAPPGVKSFGSSLCMASMSLGNYVSIVLVDVVMAITEGEGRHGWIPVNLNVGHLDRFFFMLAGLTVVDLGVYMLFAKWYKYIKLEGSEEEEEEPVLVV